jgi:hypothetical protein
LATAVRVIAKILAVVVTDRQYPFCFPYSSLLALAYVSDVAVAGLPEKREDHAVVMALFARDCLVAFNWLVKEMEVDLGPDTAGTSKIPISINTFSHELTDRPRPKTIQYKITTKQTSSCAPACIPGP